MIIVPDININIVSSYKGHLSGTTQNSVMGRWLHVVQSEVRRDEVPSQLLKRNSLRKPTENTVSSEVTRGIRLKITVESGMNSLAKLESVSLKIMLEEAVDISVMDELSRLGSLSLPCSFLRGEEDLTRTRSGRKRKKRNITANQIHQLD